MNIRVSIHDGPLGAAEQSLGNYADGAAGAVVRFEGVARVMEGERAIVALDYEAYEPMASAQLRALAEEIVRKHGLIGLRVEHSRGRVAVGECSFRLVVTSKHRKEALTAMDEFIDRMKRDVPIWKRAVWAGD